MNERERFIETLRFGKPDMIPFEPGYPRESTLAAWRMQGMPVGMEWYQSVEKHLGFQFMPGSNQVDLDVTFSMLPTFEEKVLEHKDGHYIVLDWMGAITEISDIYDYTYIRSAKDFVTRKWHRFPVENRKDWEEKIRWRYDPKAQDRFPVDLNERCEILRQRDYPLRMSINGPFWQLREWCGFEGLCLMMKDAPDLVDEMAAFWKDYMLKLLEPVLEQKVAIDYFLVNEDMAYKIHSMISPAMIRRFIMPTWQAWIDALKSDGTPILSVDSDGYIGELIPLWIESGFNCTWPIEVAAGNDIVAYRQKYGKKMAYGGGIDKRAMAAGGDVMRSELLRVIPPLLAEGGFLPGCDHGVPPDISWQNYLEYCDFLAQLTGWR